MTTYDLTPLRSINDFRSLVAYLSEELEWPLDANEVDDLTFEYDPEELGLDSSVAVKIREIKQFRPMADGFQPWGIFYIDFEPKRLPVVVLRRILGALIPKKRASAANPQQATWKLDDLLFITAFHDDATGGQQIAFAHFHQEAGDLPTLRVLGWDGGDTVLKLTQVASTLEQKLHWPANPHHVDAWRHTWSSAFRHRIGHVIKTADELADRLAILARGIRKAATTLMEHETEQGSLRRLHKAFQTALIHDLSEEDFADTYAQTITYGLLTAAISRTDMSEGQHGTVLVAGNVADMMPITNPFLREMLQTFLEAGGRKGGIDFDELGIQDVVELLRGDETDLPAILRDFGNRSPGEDPVIHFYEHFLEAYNKQLKVQRGVFYTPQPVVSYIVRSVHELLKSEFGIEDGLASTLTWGEMAACREGLKMPTGVTPDSPFVNVLDPATGTATFLVEVIDIIHRTLQTKWQQQRRTPAQQQSAWNEYVPKHLLPRLYGYELMMAPYAIAHMKIGLKLHETGYRFGSDERARIYLTNALEPASDEKAQLTFADFAPALAHEAQAVNTVKRNQRFTVVIGNPPYANYSANLSPQARHIVDKYRTYRGIPIRERNQLQFERNIQDDFVKFVAIAEDIIEFSGLGVLGYITNATSLASTSLRGMREHLATVFTQLFELHLHGGVNEIIVGTSDENVFDIAQAVAIHVLVRGMYTQQHTVNYVDLIGKRSSKYAYLSSQTILTTQWRQIQPDLENRSFVPQDDMVNQITRRLDLVFVQFGAGIKTNRDAIAIGFNDGNLLEAVRSFDQKLASSDNPNEYIQSILYRPFDVRRIFYHEKIIASRSLPTMKHMITGPNLGLIGSSTWTTPDRFSVNVSNLMVEMKTGTHDRGTTFFPIYRWESLLGSNPERIHNIRQEFVDEWSTITQTSFVPFGQGDLTKTTGPEDILYWLYGLFHSSEYRRRYKSTLAQGFPIVLLTSNMQLLRDVSKLGRALVALHLMESPDLDRHITTYTGSVNPEVEKVSYSNGTVWLDKQLNHGFQGVPENVWNLQVGGYRVCEKWLKDRRGRILSLEDIEHYHRIVVALHETIRLMGEIDAVIDAHGGWPLPGSVPVAEAEA